RDRQRIRLAGRVVRTTGDIEEILPPLRHQRSIETGPTFSRGHRENVPTLAECLQGLRDTRVQDRRLRLERQIVFTISTTKNLDHLRIRYIRVQRSDRLRHRQPDDAPYPRLAPPGQTTDIRRHPNGFDDAPDGDE